MAFHRISYSLKKKIWRTRNYLRTRSHRVWDYYVIPVLEGEALFPELKNVKPEPKAEKAVSRKIAAKKVVACKKKKRLKVKFKWPTFEFPKKKWSLPKWKLPKVKRPKLKFKTPKLPRPDLPKPDFKKWGSNIWGALKYYSLQAGRTLVFAGLLFSIGFIAINFQAYTDITMAWINQDLRGIEEGTEMEEVFVEEKIPMQELLLVQRTPEEQKSQIPDLDLEVMPPDNRLIIPKINKNVPIINTDASQLRGADWNTLEDALQHDLQNGVVHYPGTADPGELGNVFLTGHSSYYFWDPGRYKDVFARLNQLAVGDEIVVYYNQKKYKYVVRETKEVKNNDISVLHQGDEKILTLMTCSPVGTALRRLVVIAELVEV